MTKLTPIKPRDLFRILKDLGFVLDRQRGSHTIWKHPDGRVTVIPVHGDEEIRRGLLRKVLNDLDLTPADFEEMR